MPTADDKESAWIRFGGEAKRLRIRRKRLARDGLFLFGRRHAAESVTLSAAELTALFEGRTLAVDVSGEYILYVSVDAGALDAVRLLGAMSGSARDRRRGGPAASSIPQREDPGAQPTLEEKILAARIRVRIDAQQRRPRVKTPEWIVELSKGDIGR
jgi:hypothetical protein